MTSCHKGFTEFDGKVRLLKIRNPHGKGEWKGEWSDKSKIWKELVTKGGVASLGTFHMMNIYFIALIHDAHAEFYNIVWQSAR